MSIADDLRALKTTQVSLKVALEDMGVPPGEAPFADYPALVRRIQTERVTVTVDGEPVTVDGEIVTAFAPAI